MNLLISNFLPNQKQIIYMGEISFTLLQLFGACKPHSWKSRFKICLYHVYSTIMITIYFIFVFSILIFLIRAKNIDSEMETFFHFLAFFTVLFKMISIFLQSKSVVKTNYLFKNELCQPRDDYELKLLLRTSHSCR